MTALARKKTEHYTYEDYLQWDDKHRWEIIDGMAYCMSPAPTVFHQRAVVRISHFLETKLSGKKCTVFVSPIDVILSDKDVVQPDVLVVCDPKKITREAIIGAPDVIFEILSPTSGLRDKREKKELYEQSGVKEYTIVDPEENIVEYYSLHDKKYPAPEVLAIKDFLVFKSLQGLKMPLKNFLEPQEKKKTWSPKIVKFT